MDDVKEFWELIDSAPSSISFQKGTESEKLDLLLRASKKAFAIPEMRESLQYLMIECPFSMMLRPVVMLIARTYATKIDEHLEQKN